MEEQEEIKFIALPSVRQLQDQLSRLAGEPVENSAILSRYRDAQYRIVFAQRKAAVIACEAFQHRVFEKHQLEYRMRVREARQHFEQACVDSFSETCTKGL
ncbi:MAG: hypothetical protein ACREQV_24855 [Candidatus Binatia bacterium]